MQVAIVGGGIGGAALALALQQQGIAFTLFEKDDAFDARAQGYGLTLQQGGRALSRLGVALPGISSCAHFSFLPTGELLGAFGRAIYSTCATSGGGGGSRRGNVHAPRQALRSALLARVAPGSVRWGARLVGLEPAADGGVALHLACGGRADADVVVGADGIWSAVRRLKLGSGCEDPCPLRYLGVMVILGRAPCAHPLPLRHVTQTLNGSTRLYAMPFAAGVAMWQLSFPVAESEARALSGAGQAALLAAAARAVVGWHAPLPSLVAATAADCVSGYPVYDREALPAALLRGGAGAAGAALARVTLLGDAAHPMSPFKGQGANQALVDAVELAEALGDAVAALTRGPRGGGGGGGAGAGTLPCAGCGRSVASKGAARAAARAAERGAVASGEPSPGFRCTQCARKAALGPHAGPPGRAAAASAARLQARTQAAAGAGEMDPIIAALARYEEGMLQRAGEKAAQSREACRFLHSPAACAPANCTRARAAAVAAAARAPVPAPEAGEEDEGGGVAGVLSAEEFERAREMAAQLLAGAPPCGEPGGLP